MKSESAQAKRGARKPHSVTAFEHCLCGSWFRCRRQTLTPPDSSGTLCLFCTCCVTSSLRRERQDETILPFPEPMLTTEALRLTGRPRLRTKFKLRLMPEPRVSQRLKCPLPYGASIRTTVLDARRRNITAARLSTHLRSIRKSLDVPAPSGEHPSGPIARRPPWAPRSFRGRGVQKWFPLSTTPPKKNH